MKILALTDIHGAYARAMEIIKKEIPDVVVIGGDLTTVGSVKEAESALEEFGMCCERLLCVAGNMDLPAHDDLYVRRGVALNAHGVEIGGVGFFGVSAAPLSPLHTPYELTEDEIRQRILRGHREVEHVATQVFVPHAPPFGTRVDIIHSGFHVGSSAVRDFIEDHQPNVVICGHIHEARGLDEIDDSKIVNCGPASRGSYATVVINTSKQIDVQLKVL